MRAEDQLRRGVVDKITAERLSEFDRLDVAVRDGTVYWIGQIGNSAEKNVAKRVAYRALGARPK